MDTDWGQGDLAQAISDCSCGECYKRGTIYRVHSVEKIPDAYGYPPQVVALFFDKSAGLSCYFRKIRPAKKDIFKLAKAPVGKKPKIDASLPQHVNCRCTVK